MISVHIFASSLNANKSEQDPGTMPEDGFSPITPDRRETGSLKWDGVKTRFGRDVLPMWVADMDFPAPHAVIEALSQRLRHPILGYPFLGDTVQEAAASWLCQRHRYTVDTQEILLVTGVVPALYAAVRALSCPGAGVIIMPPIYPPFMQAVTDNARKLLPVPLHHAPDGRYAIDWMMLERSAEEADLLLFCSPHNPVGRVWTLAELKRLVAICDHADCCIVSDEIHADLTYRDTAHIPLGSLSPSAVILTSAGKSFNLAGLGGGIAVVHDQDNRQALRGELHRSQIHEPTLCALIGMRAAWTKAASWQAGLRRYLKENAYFISTFLGTHLPRITYATPEFGYLAWLDVRAYGEDDRIWQRLLQAGLGLNGAREFGLGGEGFLRLNFGTSQEILEQGLSRLKSALLKDD